MRKSKFGADYHRGWPLFSDIHSKFVKILLTPLKIDFILYLKKDFKY